MILSAEFEIEGKLKVEQFDDKKNQFSITVGPNRYFQSYDSIIVMIDEKGRVFLDENTWDYSRTTGKYRNMYLGEQINETRQNIKSGRYKLINLNK